MINLYQVRDECEDNQCEIKAFDPEHAARIFAEEIDCEGDYPYAHEDGGIVEVLENGIWVKYSITTETEIVYSATKVEEASDVPEQK